MFCAKQESIPFWNGSAQSKNSHSVAQSRKTYFAKNHSRMVSAQTRHMDQVRIVVILFYPSLGQRLYRILNLVGRLWLFFYPLLGKCLNLILNLAGCLFDWDIIFWSVKRFKCAALNDNWNHVMRGMLTFSPWKHWLKRLLSFCLPGVTWKVF